MESTHVISISNEEDSVVPVKEVKTLQFLFRQNKIHSSPAPITTSYPKDNKQKKSDHNIRKIIHSIKVGISLVLVSLLYILNPLFEQVGENAMWALMTVIVIFEFSAGATLGKGFNRGIGTVVGGGLGCLAAILAQCIGGIGSSIIIGTSVFIFGSVATYFRLVPSIKNKYDYGMMVLILTFNLVVVSGAHPGLKVWDIARERFLIILMGFIVCICVSLFVFPLWASDEFHDSIISRFHDLANTIEGCLEECCKMIDENENQASDGFSVCKSVLNSKSKDESLANFAKWEPWHGKFGFCYPWEKYLKIGEILRELAAFILAVGRCLQASKQPTASLRESNLVQLEPCEAIGSRLAWTLRELGDSMKQMMKCEAEAGTFLAKLKVLRTELSLVISTSMVAQLENEEVLAIASLVFLLMEVVEKVEELVKEVVELGDIARFRNHVTPVSS
ncbi:aluminum-activated malate transporter 13-like [Lotus japonicus]|uniref:aluminum-activated malate transporter 13-like n=1 Tax=Lotus japonicus TaxID=34305 RepID=UPI00258F1F62|nr:aluminum-activated malate transporter 13-like [Lotus japonicus]